MKFDAAERIEVLTLGIDASSIRAGGGVTHLVGLLRAAELQRYGFGEVIVWGGAASLSLFEEHPGLIRAAEPWLDRPVLQRTVWQWRTLPRLARQRRCDVLLVTGGSFIGDFSPVVAMSQNALPFAAGERRRYGLSWMRLRLALLRSVQARTFRGAQGVIFLTQWARENVLSEIGPVRGETVVIPHGVATGFYTAPRTQRRLQECSGKTPFRLVYVSTIDLYKHQWHVVEAVGRLREGGLPVVLDLVGPAYGPALRRLTSVLRRVDPSGEGIRYLGPVAHDALPKVYQHVDVGVFSSSCESMPMILLEMMASGLPIASSNRGPMPEVLGDAGSYFDPEETEDIARAIREMIQEPTLRGELAARAFERARGFSWRRCADETLGFLARIARGQA